MTSATVNLAATDGEALMPPLSADAALAVRGLTVSYGEKPAVFSVDATFEPATMTAIVGPPT